MRFSTSNSSSSFVQIKTISSSSFFPLCPNQVINNNMATPLPAAKPSLEPPSTATVAAEPSPPTSITTAPPKPPEPESILIPSYSRWFNWNAIHECERRHVPEFFDGRSPAKNPRIYKYYRNAIISRFRDNPTRKITFTEVRKTIVGDVGSVRRVFDFLESWGLINYLSGSSKQPQQLKWEEKESKTAAEAVAGSVDVAAPKRTVCSGCKGPCTIACFASEKHDMTLCARCFVRGNYRVGMSSTDFKRVEISDEGKTDWSDKDTLQLLEGIMHYGDDWKKIAEHVGGRSVKECVARFIKLPFAEQFGGPPDSGEPDIDFGVDREEKPSKRQRVSPLTDSSNPILAQAAFLSSLVGVDVAEVAARAAVKALSDIAEGKHQENLKAPSENAKQQVTNNASDVNDLDSLGALAEANMQLDNEEKEMEKAISSIAEETNDIEGKINHFEEFDLQMEKKWQLVRQLQDLLFVDQLSLRFHKPDATKNVGKETPKSD